MKVRLPRSPLTYVLTGLCLVAVAIAFLLVGPPSAPEAQQREVTVARGVVQSTVSGSGNLEPANELDLGFGTSGTVTAVYVEAGDDVVEGQALARLAVEEAEQALADTVLRAPANGTIAEVNGAVGDSTSGGSTRSGFVTLVDLDRLDLEVSFSESDIGKLKVGQAATVSVNALPDVKLAGKVTAIGVLSESSGSVVEYPVTVTLKQMDDRLKTGMTASADVVVEQADGAISVPSQAISPGPGGSTVTVDQDGVQQTRRVTTGLEGDSSTQIMSGLDPGDKVVIQTSSATGGAAPNLPGGGGFPGGGGGLPSGGPPGGGGFGGGGPPGGFGR